MIHNNNNMHVIREEKTSTSTNPLTNRCKTDIDNAIIIINDKHNKTKLKREGKPSHSTHRHYDVKHNIK